MHKKRPETELENSLFKGGTIVVKGLKAEEIKSFAQLYRDFVPQIYAAELLIFELENNSSFSVYRGEDSYYPIGIESLSDIQKHLSRLQKSDFESRDEVLFYIALANHLLPRNNITDGGKVNRRLLPDVDEEQAKSLLLHAFDTSMARGFQNRGYLQTATAAAIGLQGLIPEEDHDHLLRELSLKAHKAGVADSASGFSNRESNATDLRKQWLRYCRRYALGRRDFCKVPQWAQVRYTANKAGKVIETEILNSSSQEFGTFLRRELSNKTPPIRLFPKSLTSFSDGDRVFQSTYWMNWFLN